MKLSFGPRDRVEIDDARICRRHFGGHDDGQYNAEGDRNFTLIIPSEEMANALIERGYNVSIKPPRDEFEDPFMTLKVKIYTNKKTGDIDFDAIVKSRGNIQTLDVDSLEMLDRIDMAKIDFDIRPFDWEYGKRSGRTAILDGIWVEQNVNRFARRLAEEEYPEE